jgi:hypothetical protein
MLSRSSRMDHGLIESQPRRKPSNSTKSTHKCALALPVTRCGVMTPFSMNSTGAVAALADAIRFAGIC